MKPRTLRKPILLLSLAGVLLFLTGPSLIHALYRLTTSGETLRQHISEYQRLDANERHLTGDALHASRLRRAHIHYWCLARGHDIDGGDSEKNLLTPWRDLHRHWTGYP